MRNEEIAREAVKQLQDEGILAVWREYYSLVEYDKYAEDQRKEAEPIILAAINRVQSEDKARIDLLESLPESTALLIRPCNHQVSIVYGNTQPKTYEACTVREVIDAARKQKA